jgi:hypothetical protein
MMAAGQQAATNMASSLGLGASGMSGISAMMQQPLMQSATSLATSASGGAGFSAEMLSAVDEAVSAALRARSTTGLPTYRVYVGSVPFEISAEHLRQIFSPFGNIRSVNMLPSQEPGNTGHRGYGFVGEAPLQNMLCAEQRCRHALLLSLSELLQNSMTRPAVELLSMP